MTKEQLQLLDELIEKRDKLELVEERSRKRSQ